MKFGKKLRRALRKARKGIVGTAFRTVGKVGKALGGKRLARMVAGIVPGGAAAFEAVDAGLGVARKSRAFRKAERGLKRQLARSANKARRALAGDTRGLSGDGRSYTVELGDYPTKITEALTGDPGGLKRWRELRDANTAGKGLNRRLDPKTGNFAFLKPGDVLALPESWWPKTVPQAVPETVPDAVNVADVIDSLPPLPVPPGPVVMNDGIDPEPAEVDPLDVETNDMLEQPVSLPGLWGTWGTPTDEPPVINLPGMVVTATPPGVPSSDDLEEPVSLPPAEVVEDDAAPPSGVVPANYQPEAEGGSTAAAGGVAAALLAGLAAVASGFVRL